MSLRTVRSGAAVLATTLVAATCRPAAEAPPAAPAPPADRVVTDRFVVPEGLEVTLWAETPMFRNPTNLDVDSRGRIWVTEAVNYRTFKEGHPSRPGGDRVVILEDTDGDGVADTTEEFVQDTLLHAPLGMAVIGDKVIVSSAPSVRVYTDADGDDRPDRAETFLTGFGGFDHDHSLHSFVAGPDGLWYFNVGNAGPHIVTDSAGWTLRSGSVYNGGTPYMGNNRPGLVSDDGRIWTGGLALRIRPDGRGLEVLGHNFRNAYEIALDSYGNMWQNDNDDAVVTCRTTWLMEGGNAGFFSADGSRTWQADRRPGQDLFTAHWHQDDPGVIPAGDRSGAGAPTGIAVYEGDELGPEYRGMVFSADAGRNVVFGYRTPVQGAGYRLDRSDFLSSVRGSTEDYVSNVDTRDQPEKWFRPSDVLVGTDGALYVADWYDPTVGGHAVRDQGVIGRIYRIAPRGRTLRAPRLDLNTVDGQIKALLNPAINVRNAGFTRLKARGASVVPQVRALLTRENPYHRARAAFLLAQLGPAGVRETEALLSDADPQIRISAFRALRAAGLDHVTYAARLVRDPSQAVRREVALSLRDVPVERSRDLVLALAEGWDGEDRWYLEALGMAADRKEDALYPLLKQRLGAADPAAWDARFAGIAWRLHPESAVADLRARAAAERVAEAERRRALDALAFIRTPAAAQAVADLTNTADAEVAQHASWWLAFRQNNDWHRFAVSGAREVRRAEIAAPDADLIRLARALRSHETPIDARVDAAIRLAEDPAGGPLVIAMLADSLERSNNLNRAIQQGIFRNPNRHVRVLAEAFMRPQGVQPMRADAVAPLRGDPAAGQTVFYASCASCHRVGDVGAEVGPDLGHMADKYDRAGLLEAIVDPSADLAHGYEPQVLSMRDGAVLFGFVLSDGPTVAFRDVYGRRHDLPRERIESMRTLEVSVMPRPHQLELDAQGVADVTAYLLGRPASR